jgi:hypothetical protein
MDSVLAKVIATLLAGLITWLVVKYYTRSRLYCSPNRLYEYSELAEGCTVQLVVANRGRKNEEGVEVQLSNDYKYHLLAATQSGMEIDKNKCIRLPVLLRKAEVSLIFTAEGKPSFSKESIRSIKSKGSAGIVAASVGEADRTLGENVPAMIASLVLVAVMGYFIGSTIGEVAWEFAAQKITPIVPAEFKENCPIVSSNAEQEPKNGELSEAELGNFAKQSVIVEGVGVQGSRIVVDLKVMNIIEGPIEYSVKLYSHATDSSSRPFAPMENFVYDIVLMDDGESRSYRLKESFPEGQTPKRFWIETRTELSGYWVTVKRPFFFGDDAAQTCPIGEGSEETKK